MSFSVYQYQHCFYGLYTSYPTLVQCMIHTLCGCIFMTVCVLLTALWTAHAQNVTILSGSTVTLDCHPPSPSYKGFFEWRFYSSVLTDDQIYSQYPYEVNTADFSADRYRKTGEYGLEISAIRLEDGGVYGCRFLTGNVHKFTTVVVIGQILCLCY